MTIFIRTFLALAALLSFSVGANARVTINVDLSTQRMHVVSGSGASYSWPISSARSGYVTPRGTYHPTSLQTMHRSKKYHNSPMPHSIFFNGGYAIHGTYSTGALGSPASHGCIRLSPGHAAQLFSMVKGEGATINISGSPRNTRYASRHHSARHYAAHSSRRYAVAHSHHRYSNDSALSYAPRHSSAWPVRMWQRYPDSAY